MIPLSYYSLTLSFSEEVWQIPQGAIPFSRMLLDRKSHRRIKKPTFLTWIDTVVIDLIFFLLFLFLLELLHPDVSSLVSSLTSRRQSSLRLKDKARLSWQTLLGRYCIVIWPPLLALAFMGSATQIGLALIREY